MTPAAVLLAALLWALPADAQEGSEANPGLIQAGGGLLFYSTEGPLSFTTMTRREAPAGTVPSGEVRGRSCQHALTIPTGRAGNLSGAVGKGGYEKAVQDILSRDPALVGIYDVKVDVQILSILFIYRRMCVEVTATGLRPGP